MIVIHNYQFFSKKERRGQVYKSWSFI